MSPIPGVKHKVIGLVSGGKDSCFNLMHCVANGHEIVAIATLQPEPGIDELDSHLYQSVGTQLLPIIARAMNLPLFTRYIKGKAVEKGPEYGDRSKGGEGSETKGDETEDLTLLLKDVMAKHPNATALSSGAILSNYQRLRIEHVCGRLGLVSLAYLWQQPQLPLLESMFTSGLRPVLVKVAGVGLSVDSVGKDLASMMPTFRKLEREYGSHPAGEGGEYETLTVDSPLFSHRLEFTKSHVVVTDPEPYPVAYLKVEEAELVEKAGWTRPTVEELRSMLQLDDQLDGLDEKSRDAMEQLEAIPDVESTAESSSGTITTRDEEVRDGCRMFRRGRWFAAAVDGQTHEGEDVASELRRCFDQISGHGLSLPIHAAHITLLLSSMSLFGPANALYTTYFGTSPPSRATVAVPLPSSQRVKVEVVGFDDRRADAGSPVGSRQALHVQSLSYWAPANIGPYSQAIIVNGRVHIAGQIPLVPASLTLPILPLSGSPYPHQTVLALQHVGRIVDVLRSKNSTGGGWSGWGESCVAWYTRPPGTDSGEVKVVGEAWSNWARENNWDDVPVVFLRAKELPRGALVEYQVDLHTGRRDPTLRGDMITSNGHKDGNGGADADEDDDDDDDELEPDYAQSRPGAGVLVESCRTGGRVARGARAIAFAKNIDALRSTSLPGDLGDRVVSVKVYFRPDLSTGDLVGVVEKWLGSASGDRPCVTLVPVLDIHDRNGDGSEVALEIFGA